MQQREHGEEAIIEWLGRVPFGEVDVPTRHSHASPVDYQQWLAAGRQLAGVEAILTTFLATQDRGVDLAQVAYALGWLGGPGSGPALMQALSYESARVRIEAAAALGRIRFNGAVHDLCNLLIHDDDQNVRANAAWALGVIGGTFAQRCLQSSLHDPDSFVRELVGEALRQIQSESPTKG